MFLKSNPKKHKKTFETTDLAEYSIIYNEERYRAVAYYRFGLAKGYLVMCENGEVCSREKAKGPFKMLIEVNSYMNGFYKQGYAEINKPLHVFQETIVLSKEVNAFVVQNKDNINQLISKIEELDRGFNRLKEIYKEADKIFRHVNESKELILEDVKNIASLKNEFTILQYKHLYIQLDFRKYLQPVLIELKEVVKTLNREEKRKVNKALNVMQHLCSDKFQKGICKSLKGFEADGQGKQVRFFSEPNWEFKLIENVDVQNEVAYENEVLPMLRNY